MISIDNERISHAQSSFRPCPCIYLSKLSGCVGKGYSWPLSLLTYLLRASSQTDAMEYTPVMFSRVLVQPKGPVERQLPSRLKQNSTQCRHPFQAPNLPNSSDETVIACMMTFAELSNHPQD